MLAYANFNVAEEYSFLPGSPPLLHDRKCCDHYVFESRHRC